MRVLTYLFRRMIFFIPQILGILLVSFFLIKLIPGDPAVMMLGPSATEEAVSRLRTDMGLDQPLWVQFGKYLTNLVQGDLGTSWQTTKPVLTDLLERLPATLELVLLGLILASALGIGLGVASAMRKTGIVRKISNIYGLFAGAIPDFWLALVLIYIFYTMFQIAPAPLGRISMVLIPPDPVTGSAVIDSLIAGRSDVFLSALSQLVLPVLTIGAVMAGPILKVTYTTMERMLNSDCITYARICGLPTRTIRRQAFHLALPAIITIICVLFGLTIGTAMLIEIIFGWGGAGQYAVAAVLSSDINPVLGFVIFSALLSLVLYLVADLLHFFLDPRIRG